MSNINKIKISGNTYTIEDSNAAKAVELTQAEYDALVSGGTVDPTVFYIITDATPIDVSTFVTSGQMTSAITQATSGKVDTSAITSSVTSASTDNEIPTAKAVYDQMGGLKLVKLTQSAYDALSPNYDSNTLYVIVN